MVSPPALPGTARQGKCACWCKCTLLAVKIAGLGKYLPERIVTSAELEKQLEIPSGWVEQITDVLRWGILKNINGESPKK